MNKNLVEKIIAVVRSAGEMMKPENIEVIQKGNASNFVTTADLKVQEFLKTELLDLIPGSAFVGEEEDGAAITGNVINGTTNMEYIWVVDPIDGTSNFIREIGMSAISVGLLKWGKPYAGVLYQEGFPLDRPVALVGANTKENFEKIKEIVCEEIKELPY